MSCRKTALIPATWEGGLLKYEGFTFQPWNWDGEEGDSGWWLISFWVEDLTRPIPAKVLRFIPAT